MRFRVLGAVELLSPTGISEPVRSPNQRRLLAALLARPGQVVTFDALVDMLWPEGPPASVVTTLRTYVSRLRQRVGPALAARGGGYALDVEAHDLDAGRFEMLLTRAALEPPLAVVSLIEEALALWTGPAFGSEADLPVVRAEAIRLEERRGAARQTLAAALLAGDRAAEATAVAEALVTDEPLRESAWSVLVGALAAEGRAAEGLRAYQRAAALLAEAGLDPSEQLRAAERRALDASSSPSAPGGRAPTGTPSLSAVRRPPPPRRTSSFVGRSADVDHVEELLDKGRLVTLVGPGGVGKTRLALEVAARRAATLRHGVAWVDLAPLPEDSSVREEVTAAVDPSATTAGTGFDVDHLEMLVVLDNAEHVLDSTCEVVGSLIDAGTGVQVLVTSRERLGTESERVVPVAPLTADGPASPGRRLLLDRVQASGSTVRLDPDDDRVGALLARLDGLPLAIEMAAAQLATTSLDELVDAVSRRSTDIDPLPRGVPDRHRSLAAVLEWSERRLEPEERTLLTEMSVFAGSLPVADIETALDRAGSATAVRRLVDRSLVVADLTGSPARYGLLQTVRDHGRDRLRDLGDLDDRSERHARWCVASVTTEGGRLLGPEEGDAHRRLDFLLPELRSSFVWARTHRRTLAVELVTGLYDHARVGLRTEPLRWAEDLLGDGDGREPGVLAAAGAHALARADLARARRLADEALATDGPHRFAALDVRGDVDLFQGALPSARAYYQRMRHEATDAGNELYEALGFTGILLSHAYTDTTEQADLEIDRLRDREFSNPSARAWARYAMGEVILDRDPSDALAHLEAAIAIGQEADSWYVVNMAVVSAMSLRARRGDTAEALVRFGDVIRTLDELGDRAHLVTVLRNLAILFARIDEPSSVATLLGFLDQAGNPTFGAEADRLDLVRSSGRDALGETRWNELHALGAAMDPFTAAGWATTAIDGLTPRLTHDPVGPDRSIGPPRSPGGAQPPR